MLYRKPHPLAQRGHGFHSDSGLRNVTAQHPGSFISEVFPGLKRREIKFLAANHSYSDKLNRLPREDRTWAQSVPKNDGSQISRGGASAGSFVSRREQSQSVGLAQNAKPKTFTLITFKTLKSSSAPASPPWSNTGSSAGTMQEVRSPPGGLITLAQEFWPQHVISAAPHSRLCED